MSGGDFTVASPDTTPPVVQSIALQGPPAANAASVTYRVTFNENANLVSTDDFALTTTGGASGNIASVSAASGTTIDVVVDTLAGDGTIRLDLQGATDIDDDLDNTPPAAFTSGGVHTVNRAAPAVTDGNISISGASGTAGAVIIGDTVTATWNNTAGGDNNSDIASVTVDFTAFGGGAAVVASNSSNTWTATYTITAGAIDATGRNVSVTATDTGANATTTADTTNATVDNQAPTVSDSAISISGASGAGGAFITGDTVTATWNDTAGGDNNADSIAGVTVDFTQFGGGAAVAASNSSDTWTATHTITAGSANGSNQNVSVTATDNAGNGTTTADTTGATVDTSAPSVNSVGVPANATYRAGQNLDFTVNFNEVVTVNTGGGTPQIAITIGSTTRQAEYVSGSGTTALLFRYAVQAGDNDADGIAIGALSANGGTLRDGVGNDAALALNSVGVTTGVLVDTTAPSVSSVSVPANATYTTGQNLDFTVNFNEAVTVNTGGGTPQIALTIGSTTRQAVYTSGAGTTALLFRYAVQAGDNDADGIAVGALSANGGTLRDGGGNDANLTLNSVGATTGVLVDASAPSVSSVGVPSDATYTAGQNLDFTVNFSEAVTVNTGGGTPQIAITIGATTRQAVYTSGAGTTALLFRYAVQAGDNDADGIAVGALAANGGTLRDGGGNDANLTLNSVGATTGVLVDASAPSVSSVGVPANATYRAGQNLDFTVNFSEAVTVNTGGGTPQIAITIGATTRQAVYTSGAGTTALLFRYAVQAGDNDADGIAVGALSANGGTLRDGVGNDAALALNGVGVTTAVLVDTTAPTGYTVSFDDTVYDATETGAVSFTMAGAETGTSLDYTISSNNGGAPVTGNVPSVASATEQVTGIDVSGLNDGTLTVSVTLTDAGGNAGAAVTDTATLSASPPAFSKLFAPDSIVLNGTSTLTFTIDNSAVAVASSALDFTDNFPAGMTVATPANAATTCTGGTLTAVSGAGAVSYTGGSVAAGASCTVSVDVTGATPGALVNTSGDLTSSQGNSGTASDTLTVIQSTFSIADVAVNEDAGTATFTVTLSTPPVTAASVNYATSDGTATVGDDYTAASGTLNFAIGDDSESFTVAIADDTLDEAATETFLVNLSAPVNATIADGSATGTITDNDGAPSISIADVTVTEDAGSASFTVSLSNPSASTVTVDFATVDGAAVAGSDYAATSGTLTFTPGDTEETVTVTLIDDGLNEPLEGFTVELSAATNATLADASGQGTITDNDGAPSLSITDAAVDEGAGTASFTVSLSAASGQTVTVDFTTVDGAAVAGSDYAATSGTLTFTPGDTEETVTVTLIDDGLNEPLEGFTVELSAATNATLADASGQGTITDNDGAPSLSIADISVNEGAGTAVFTVSLSTASGQTVTVDFATADGTALAGSDYAATSGTLTFTPGDTEETVTVTLIDDGGIEATELFTIDLSGPVNASLGDASANGTITDDDSAPSGYAAAFDVDPIASASASSASFSFAGAQIGATYSFTISSSGGGAPVTGAGTIASATQQVSGIDVSGLGDGVLTLTARLADTFGNQGLDVTDTATKETTRPAVSITNGSSGQVSGLFTVTVTFTEDVTGFELGDLTVANGAASNFTPVSGSVYTADITPAADGVVTVDVASGVAQDGSGNSNSAAAQFSISNDQTAPSVTITAADEAPVADLFTVTVTFSEEVTGFELDDVTVGNGAASNFAGSGAVYTVDITPAADGAVTVDVAAGAASDSAGNGNIAAEQFSIESDSTPPGLVVSTQSSEVTGAFTATFTFTEAVTGFELADIMVTNGAVDAVSGSGAVYTATITPQTLGAVVIAVAAGAAQDIAGNLSLAGDVSVDAVSEAQTVSLVLSSGTTNTGDVAATATISNPGSDPLSFTALADVSWIDVTPSSGTIPSLSALDLTVSLNDNVNALEPGDYTGTVTVTVGGAASTASASSSAQASATILASIPISLAVEARLGSIELVATTPAGAAGEASFTYASDLEALNAVTLTTSNGRASLLAGENVVFGRYAITQSAPPGWRVESIACAGDLDGGSSFDPASGQAVIDLDPGEALVCTYENVRDEDAVRVATQRAIRNFMARRADRLVAAAPDFSQRFSERGRTQRGAFSADIDGSGRSQMAFSASLAGMRNAAAADTPQIAGVTNYERPFAEHWDVWVAAEVARVKDDRAGDNASSDFAVAQLGVDYQLSDTFILGLMTQYDWMDEASGDINTAAGAIAGARVEGEGWMAGPYAVWRVRDQLIFDALAMYGSSDNTVNPLGLYEDDFETDRFMIRANLTGEYASGAWRLRPQANLTHFEETQAGYVDSLNITIPEQTLTLGRLAAGPEVAWRHARAQGGYLEVATSVRAVWDYQAAELLNEAGRLTGGDDDLRADARLGLNAGFASGMTLRVEAGFAGLGVGAFEATAGRLELRIPFGAPGRVGRSAGGVPFAGAERGPCDGPAGQGFSYAAGQMNACDTAGLGGMLR